MNYGISNLIFLLLYFLSVDLHDTLATMHERACQASVALSAYTRVSKGHTALTSECGTMLDEV